MELRVLGAVRMHVGGRRVELGAGKELAIVAALGLAAGSRRGVTADVLIDQVWDGEPPARTTLQANISRIRKKLDPLGIGPNPIPQDNGVYRLPIVPESIDWFRFKELQSRATHLRTAGEYGVALGVLDEALELWDGEALTGVQGRWAQGQRETMRVALQSVRSAWAETALHARPDEDHSDALTGFLAESPGDEPLLDCLMAAYQAAGRNSEALAAFFAHSHRLREEQGTTPASYLVRRYESILRGDPYRPPRTAGAGLPAGTGVPAPRPEPSPAPPVPEAPRNSLPPYVADFTDRTNEISALVSAATGRRGIHVVTGMPGVGKTALAVRAAHRIKGWFPDRQMYLHLRGYQDTPRLEPMEALQELLSMLGSPAQHLPSTLEQRIALWRDRTADMRGLLVLDDAATAEQVIPLLPSSPRCMVVVTSRSRLTGLDGARQVSLDSLSTEDAKALFLKTVGHDPGYADADLAEVVELCHRLPLVLRLTGNWLRTHSTWTLPRLCRRLRENATHVHGLPDLDRKLGAVLTLAVKDLSPTTCDAFLRFGLHPESEFSLSAAAALAGTDEYSCEEAIEELVDLHLIHETQPGLYRMHGLITAFAKRSGRLSLHGEQARAACVRVLDYYLGACEAADRRLSPDRKRMPTEPSGSPTLPVFTDSPAAAAWLTSTRSTLLAVIDWAYAQPDLAEYGARLSHLLAGYLYNYGPWGTAVRVQERAVEVWTQRAHSENKAYALIDLGRNLMQTGDHPAALARIEQSLAIWERTADSSGLALALDTIGMAYARQDKLAIAQVYLQRALGLYRASDEQTGYATCLDHIGNLHYEAGRTESAVEKLNQSLDLYHAMDDVQGIAGIKVSLSSCFKTLGRHREAIQLAAESLELFQRLGDRQIEGTLHGNIGVMHAERGEHTRAIRSCETAVSIHRATGDRRSEIRFLTRIAHSLVESGEAERALAGFTTCQRINPPSNNPEAEARILSGFGKAYAALSEPEQAEEYFTAALDLIRSAETPTGKAEVLLEFCLFLIGRDETQRARSLIEEGTRICEGLNFPEARTLRLLKDSLSLQRH
ncbi:AfsR/SARP family transcriptional regulator [Nocardiopsis ansamitocini]|uniref:SARP family transcriptional regulator n=1 Tax=Nocardiopsis ansamitocini TaxID=1670832 RepID=A0A9W6P4I6_9ACTN|nr:tetratricopeptide repeat protein [Nocardiopsis ansamitocini]GLU46963.1 SARP family transcriptional regulator [Nocardiopsis ansamitocini]